MKIWKSIVGILLISAMLTTNVFGNASSTSQAGIDQGASRLFVGNGGTFDLESGAIWQIAELAVSASSADINQLVGPLRAASATFTLKSGHSTGTLNADNANVNLPKGSIIMDGFIDVGTSVAAVATTTYALTLENSGDLIAAAATNTNQWTKGIHLILPNSQSVFNFVKTTLPRNIQLVSSGGNGSPSGSFTVFLRYYVSPQ